MNSFVLLGALVGSAPPLDRQPDPSEVGQGWIGFVMFLFLAVSTVLLWLSFRRQLKKVNFEEKPDPPRTQPGAGREAGPRPEPGPAKP